MNLWTKYGPLTQYAIMICIVMFPLNVNKMFPIAFPNQNPKHPVQPNFLFVFLNPVLGGVQTIG